MLSSIFNSEPLREYLKLPRARHQWHALVVVCCLSASLLALQSRPGERAAPALGGPNTAQVIIGSSHVRDGIILSALPPDTVRLWLLALDLQLAAATLETHRQEWPRLKLVAFELDEWTLLTDTVQLYSKDIQGVLHRLGMQSWNLPDRPASRRSFSWKIQLFFQQFNLAELLRKDDPDLDWWMELARESEWIPTSGGKRTPTPGAEKPNSGITAEAAEARVHHLEAVRIHDPETNIQALAELTRRLTEEKITVVLLTPPSTLAYRSARPPEYDRLMEQAVREVTSRSSHPQRILIWNHRAHPGFDDQDFSDVDHLNPQGAEKYSRFLNQEIRKAVAP